MSSINKQLHPGAILSIFGALLILTGSVISVLSRTMDPAVYVQNDDSTRFVKLCEQEGRSNKNTEVAMTWVGYLALQGSFGQDAATSGLASEQIGPCPYQYSRLTTSALDIYVLGIGMAALGWYSYRKSTKKGTKTAKKSTK